MRIGCWLVITIHGSSLPAVLPDSLSPRYIWFINLRCLCRSLDGKSAFQKSAQYLHKELPVRLAKRLVDYGQVSIASGDKTRILPMLMATFCFCLGFLLSCPHFRAQLATLYSRLQSTPAQNGNFTVLFSLLITVTNATVIHANVILPVLGQFEIYLTACKVLHEFPEVCCCLLLPP